MVMLPIRWLKRGACLGFNGHKHHKGQKTFEFVDDLGNFLIGGITKPGNLHDSSCLVEALDRLTEIIELLQLEVHDSCLTLDPGFDSIGAHEEVEMHELTPYIKPNPRNGKDPELLHEQFERFDEIKDVYKERYKIERSFAWEKAYRKLGVRHEKLKETHEGFRLLAHSLINLRWFIKGH